MALHSGPRITRLPGGYPLGPLGRAIHDRGGVPLSVDPHGLGVVQVHAGGAREAALIVAGPRAGRATGSFVRRAAIILGIVVLVVVWWPRGPAGSVEEAPQAEAGSPATASVGAPSSPETAERAAAASRRISGAPQSTAGQVRRSGGNRAKAPRQGRVSRLPSRTAVRPSVSSQQAAVPSRTAPGPPPAPPAPARSVAALVPVY